MSLDPGLRKVHALSVLSSTPTVRIVAPKRRCPVPARLRLVEVMQLQQALHNAHLPGHVDPLGLFGQFLGRDITSLSAVEGHELRPLLRHLVTLSRASSE